MALRRRSEDLRFTDQWFKLIKAKPSQCDVLVIFLEIGFVA
jgi:hypothetical protein